MVAASFYKHKNVVLKDMDIRESELYRRLRNMDEIRKCFFSDAIISETAQQAWFQSYLQDKTEQMFSVLNEDGEFIGGCSLYRIQTGFAEFGRLVIDPHCRGRGYGKNATQAAIELGIKMGIHTFYLEVFADNGAAISIYKSCGFSPSGDTFQFADRDVVPMILNIKKGD